MGLLQILCIHVQGLILLLLMSTMQPLTNQDVSYKIIRAMAYQRVRRPERFEGASSSSNNMLTIMFTVMFSYAFEATNCYITI